MILQNEKARHLFKAFFAEIKKRQTGRIFTKKVQSLASRNSNFPSLGWKSLRFLQYVWNVKNYLGRIVKCFWVISVSKYVLEFRLTKVKEIWDWSFGCKKALALYTLPVLSYGPIFVHYFRNSKRGFGQFCACTRWQKQWHVCQTHCMEFSNWKSTSVLF